LPRHVFIDLIFAFFFVPRNWQDCGPTQVEIHFGRHPGKSPKTIKPPSFDSLDGSWPLWASASAKLSFFRLE